MINQAKKLILKVKIWIYKANLRWVRGGINDVEKYLCSVTTADPAYLIIDAKEELADLKAESIILRCKLVTLETELKELSKLL